MDARYNSRGEGIITVNVRPFRLFLLRPGALGDTLLLAPALAALKALVPGIQVALAAQPAAGRLIAQAGLVDLALSRDDPRLAALFGTSGNLDEALACLGHLDAAVAWLDDSEGLVERNLAALGASRVVVAPSQPPPGSGIHVAEHLAAGLESVAGQLLALPEGASVDLSVG